MLHICPQCHAENEDVARFCNQCGAPLDNALEGKAQPVVTAPAPEEKAPASSGGANWTALFWLAAVIVAIWWIVGSKPKEQAMQGAGGGAMPQQVLEDIATYKATLADDPTNIEALRSMQEIYGMVGKMEEVLPFAETAMDAYGDKLRMDPGNVSELSGMYEVAEMLDRVDEVSPFTMAALHDLSNPGEDADMKQVGDRMLNLFVAAYQYQDDENSLKILQTYHEMFPENTRIPKVLGDLCYDTGKFTEAIAYYDKYLATANMDDDPENYLNAMTDKGSCHIQKAGDEDPDADSLEQAIAIFDEVLRINPDFWQAHFNRGVALGKLDRQDEALAEWNWCEENTTDAMDKWRAQYAIAELKGETLPSMPASPHGEGFGGMGNPHGEGGMMNPHAEGGMMNPHGEGSAPPLDGNNLPPNPHSEEWLEQQQGNSSGDSAASDG